MPNVATGRRRVESMYASFARDLHLVGYLSHRGADDRRVGVVIEEPQHAEEPRRPADLPLGVEAGGHRVGDGVRPAEPPDERHAGAEEQHDQHDLRVECALADRGDEPVQRLRHAVARREDHAAGPDPQEQQRRIGFRVTIARTIARSGGTREMAPNVSAPVMRLPPERSGTDDGDERPSTDDRNPRRTRSGASTRVFVGFVGPIRRFRVLVGRTMVQ